MSKPDQWKLGRLVFLMLHDEQPLSTRATDALTDMFSGEGKDFPESLLDKANRAARWVYTASCAQAGVEPEAALPWGSNDGDWDWHHFGLKWNQVDLGQPWAWWGARAIIDRGHFDLLPDRQTAMVPKLIQPLFKEMLDSYYLPMCREVDLWSIDNDKTTDLADIFPERGIERGVFFYRKAWEYAHVGYFLSELPYGVVPPDSELL